MKRKTVVLICILYFFSAFSVFDSAQSSVDSKMAAKIQLNESKLKMLREEKNFYEHFLPLDIWPLYSFKGLSYTPVPVQRELMIKVITISYYKELIEDNRRFDKAELVRRIKEWREIAATNKEQIKKRVALINRQIESIELETYNLMNSINRSNMKDIDTSAVVDLNGLWKTSYFVNNKSGKKVMVTYTITQTPGKNTFSWSVNGPGISETTKDGKITGKGIKIKYNRTAGPHQTGGKYVEVKGTVVTYQGNNRAKEIRWDNGVVWYR